VRRPIEVMYDLDAAQKATIRRYTAELQDRVVEAVATAIAALAPARLSLHRGSAGFAVSRRLLTDDGVRMGPNPAGEADHSVTVLRIADLGDVTRGVLFSYACHPTTLGSDVRELTGDYPGFARMELEASYPGAAALFLQGCGADCCPSEHGSFEVVRRHGQALATAVGEALSSPGIDVSGRLSSAYCEAHLAFAPLPPVEELKARLQDDDVYVRRHAQHVLTELEAGRELPTHHVVPVQTVQMGETCTLVALGGEPVVGYALRLKRELGEAHTWVVGYSNDITAYVPSRRVLEEGGFEPYYSMILVGAPGPLADTVEETIIDTARDLVARVRTTCASDGVRAGPSQQRSLNAGRG